MSKRIKIGNKWIGEKEPCFIIAEAGSNHDQKLSQAKKLIDIAVWAGADAVKFQLFKAEKHYPKLNADGKENKFYKLTKKKELPKDWIPEIAKHCKKRNIIFICSVFYKEAVDILKPYVDAFKIASSEMTHYPLIQYAYSTKKPLIISTGMSNLKEVDQLVNMLDSLDNRKRYILLHCTVGYPIEFRDANLKVITTLKNRYEVPVGISDHTKDHLVVPISAVSLGANIIEKHFTLSHSLKGSDHYYALEPDELNLMIKAIRGTGQAMGSSKKIPTYSERDKISYLRRMLFTTKNIRKGDVFNEENIDILRATNKGFGLEPVGYFKVLGKKAQKDIKAYRVIKRKHLLLRSRKCT